MMARVLTVCLLTAAAVACGGGDPPNDVARSSPAQATTTVSTTTGTSATTVEPATMAEPAATALPTTPTSTDSTEYGQNGTVFEDPFDAGLDAEWRWVAEDPSRWSVTDSPGVLRITAATAPGEPLENVLVRSVPNGDFEMRTLLSFEPTSNFQFAGLVVYSDPTSFLQLGRAYCDVESVCVGDGVYFDSVEQSQPTGENHAFAVRTTDDVHLRLLAEGDSYTGYYSSDGETWVTIGSHTRGMTARQVGLLAHQTTVEIVAEFEYFALIGDQAVESGVEPASESIGSGLPRYSEVVAVHWAGVELCKTQAGISGGPDVFAFGAFGEEASVLSVREDYPTGFCPGARYIVSQDLVLDDGTEFPVGSLLTVDGELQFVAVSSWD